MNLLGFENKTCPSCGKLHYHNIKDIIIEKNAISKVSHILKNMGATKVFVLADINTFAAAGEKVKKQLEDNNIPYSEYVFPSSALEPDEAAVGSAVMHYDYSCDAVISIGSGVINDIGKILSATAKVPYIIVATAPSMDGYASSTSSMILDGLKVTLPSKCADVIIGDTDILKNAPLHMLKAGLGDMLAKYISICEWRIANLICGEYYCEAVAALVRDALKKCVENADGLLRCDEAAVKAVFEGLVIGGVAMTYAGLSRPASGVEHYFSHVWDMRSLEFNKKADLHGIQCANGTLLALNLYNALKNIPFSREKAVNYVKNFNFQSWCESLSAFIGKGSAAMIAAEENDKKYDIPKHNERIDIIINNRDKILSIIDEELPDIKWFEKLFARLDFPSDFIETDTLPLAFKATKDIRYKYVLSHLAWDLGVIDELAEKLLLI